MTNSEYDIPTSGDDQSNSHSVATNRWDTATASKQTTALPPPKSAIGTSQNWAIDAGTLVIDHAKEGIENAIRSANFGDESVIHFDNGVSFQGTITGGSIHIEGTLIVGREAKVKAKSITCGRLFVSGGSVECADITCLTLVAWEGEINASGEIRYCSLEQAGHCDIQGRLVRNRS